MNSTAPPKVNKTQSLQRKTVKNFPRKPKPHFITKVQQNPKRSNSPEVLVGKGDSQHQTKAQAVGSQKIHILSHSHNNTNKEQQISPKKTPIQKKINQRKCHLSAAKQSRKLKPVENRPKRIKKVKKQPGQQRPMYRHCPSG